jgi:hypothetical protein
MDSDIWTKLAAALPPDAIQWRQQGKPQTRDGRHIARFVAYIDAQFVQGRFDAVVPGEWDTDIELLPPAVTTDGEEVEPFSFKCRIGVVGVHREDVGSGKDYKTAATDAFKRAAVRFGVGSELYSMEQLWVQMDGDGKYAKPIEDPAVVYARKHGRPQAVRVLADAGADIGVTREALTAAAPERQRGELASGSDEISHTAGPLTSDEAQCPKCDGRMWDNRLTKRNPKAPDFKCRDRACDGVIWPPKETRQSPARAETERGLDMEEIPF